jgi:hypothetical protein
MEVKNNKLSKWTNEERDRIVGAFQILLKADKKQNPHLYEIKKETSNRRNKKDTKHK